MNIQSIQLRILGKEYRLRCPEGQESALRLAAAEVEARMKQLRGLSAAHVTESVAVVTAINLAYELQHKKPAAPAQQQQQQLVDEMHKQLDVFWQEPPSQSG